MENYIYIQTITLSWINLNDHLYQQSQIYRTNSRFFNSIKFDFIYTTHAEMKRCTENTARSQLTARCRKRGKPSLADTELNDVKLPTKRAFIWRAAIINP